MHSPTPAFLLLTVIAVGFAAACRNTAATPPPAAAVSADTWAVVDGRPITRDTVEKAYRRLGNPPESSSNEEVLAAKLTVLNDLIIQDILLARARQLKIEVPAADIDAAYADAKKNIPDDAFQQELAARGVTAADMREAVSRQLLTEKVIAQEVGAKAVVTDQEVTDFFNANRAQFNVAEEAYRLAQIVITPVREPQVANRTGDDAATPQAATAKAQMIMERLKTGASFGDLAMDYSEDPETAPRGGDLGLVPISRLKQAPPPLRDAVLNVAPGNARLVSLGGGHTIVLVVAHEQPGQRDLSMPAVKDGITTTLRGRREQLLRAAYLSAAQSDADVVNYLARRVVESNGKMPAAKP